MTALIPAHTYSWVPYDANTIAEPVGLYTIDELDNEAAYLLTKAFWAWRNNLSHSQPWLQTVQPEDLNNLGAPIHYGAAQYYKQAGVTNIPVAEMPQ